MRSWQRNCQNFGRSRRGREQTPACSPQSSGAVEFTIGHLTGQVRTLRGQVEMMHSVTLDPNMCIWPRLTRHASWLMNRFSVRASGRAEYEEAIDSERKGGCPVWEKTILVREAESYTFALVVWAEAGATQMLCCTVFGGLVVLNKHTIMLL